MAIRKPKGPNIVPKELYLQAGINPKNGLPVKISSACPCDLKEGIKAQLAILDEQDAINRYKWYNLPSGLDGQLLERILYYTGQAAFFYMSSNDTFYFLPYTLDGNIDVYGRFLGITPLPFRGVSQATNNKSKRKKEKVQPWITGLIRKPVIDVLMEVDENTFEEGCVLLHDFSIQDSETNIARKILQEPVLNAMAEAFPFARTSLLANSGVKGVRVPDATQAEAVNELSADITRSALEGNPLLPVVGSIDYQELTNGAPLKSEEYLLYLQALDNYRLSLYGLETGGLFQKKSHMLEAEQSMNSGNAKLAYNDGLTRRQRFCDIVNSIWALGIWCEPSESVLNMDMDGDGVATDEEDQSGVPGEQPQVTEGDTENE